MKRLVALLTIALGGLCGLIIGASAQEVIRIGCPTKPAGRGARRPVDYSNRSRIKLSKSKAS